MAPQLYYDSVEEFRFDQDIRPNLVQFANPVPAPAPPSSDISGAPLLGFGPVGNGPLGGGPGA